MVACAAKSLNKEICLSVLAAQAPMLLRGRHGRTSVAGSFIQTLTMVDIATGWTVRLPLVTRNGSLVVEGINRAQRLFPWPLRGVDFDNDSAFMNDVVAPWCRHSGGAKFEA
jgi:hypothetical protein